jgi:sRNA-binding carbon storage regulator CsrA
MHAPHRSPAAVLAGNMEIHAAANALARGDYRFSATPSTLQLAQAQTTTQRPRKPVSIQEATMLVLTRRIGESVFIYPSEGLNPDTPVSALFENGPIRLTLTRINGNQARLGITAPASLSITREEVA